MTAPEKLLRDIRHIIAELADRDEVPKALARHYSYKDLRAVQGIDPKTSDKLTEGVGKAIALHETQMLENSMNATDGLGI
jgi:hypothetical protein